jgi:hypothetical protein
MSRTVDITLDKPLIGHNGPIHKVVVREPTFAEYLKFGDPFIWVPLAGGGAFPSENLGVIASYIGICVVEPNDALIIQLGGLDLARKIKDAIVGFFLPASEADAG